MAENTLDLKKGDKVIVKGNGVAVEEGVIEYVGKYFITYKGPAYLKTVNEFDYNNGRVKIEKIDWLKNCATFVAQSFFWK